jgi:murein DD-endopeptidase MepM/ murein hydrolase activator NlpD
MNTNMWENNITQRNIEILKQNDYYIVNPVVGKLACGDYGIGKLPSPKNIIKSIDEILHPIPIWQFPLKFTYRGTTTDSFSFLDYDWSNTAEINLFPHVGSFGVRRRFDKHKGIDIYAPVGTPVFAVEEGKVVDVCPFTGEKAGYPFWEETVGVYVYGKSGIVVYGELQDTNLKIDDVINAGDLIGHVGKVLKKDKGRPMSMLHLELHYHNYIHTAKWDINEKYSPVGLQDPTEHLIKSIKHGI